MRFLYEGNCIIYIGLTKASQISVTQCHDIEKSGTIHTFFPPAPSLSQTGPSSQNRINISLVKKVSLAPHSKTDRHEQPPVMIFLLG